MFWFSENVWIRMIKYRIITDMHITWACTCVLKGIFSGQITSFFLCVVCVRPCPAHLLLSTSQHSRGCTRMPILSTGKNLLHIPGIFRFFFSLYLNKLFFKRNKVSISRWLEHLDYGFCYWSAEVCCSVQYNRSHGYMGTKCVFKAVV